MRLVVDGIIFQKQAHGGISRLYREILPRMCDLDPSLQISLLTDGNLWQAPPEHPQIERVTLPRLQRYLRPGRLWKPILPTARGLLHRLCTGSGQGKVWHSTYYTSVPEWEGGTVVTVVDMIHERFWHQFGRPVHDQFRERKRRCVVEADAVICISRSTEKEVREIYGTDSVRTRVVPLAYSEIFRPLDKNALMQRSYRDRPFVLYVGNRTAGYKNFGTLLLAYSRWPGRTEVDLVVVGGDWSDGEKRTLQALDLRESVAVCKAPDDEALCQLYNEASAFVYPSLSEGFGIPLLEAMACHCPIVASRIPSTLEVAGPVPIYFDPEDPDELVIALDTVLEEGRESARVRLGIERARQFSWDETASQTLEVYREVSGAG